MITGYRAVVMETYHTTHTIKRIDGRVVTQREPTAVTVKKRIFECDFPPQLVGVDHEEPYENDSIKHTCHFTTEEQAWGFIHKKIASIQGMEKWRWKLRLPDTLK